jgi:DNA repair exonuclease SbcCD nuclease subunit
VKDSPQIAERREVLMAGQSFRFLHTGGFHLESTLDGLADVPEHLTELLAAAPFQAVENVTEAAIREDVDFVVLCGDIVEPLHAGPAALAFLQRQCEQLRIRKIPVYWAASQSDQAGDFLPQMELPDNVRVFVADRVEPLTFSRGDTPVVTLVGRSWNEQRPLRATEFAREEMEGFQLAVLYSRGDLDGGPRPGVSYWALGGCDAPRDVFASQDQIIHAAGRPQGFGPAATGPRGCTLVSVDGEGEIRTRRIETDAARWHDERVTIDGGISLRDARSTFRSQVERLMANLERPLLVRWTLAGPGRFDSPLMRRKNREEMLDWLRNDFGHRSPPLWSLALEVEPPETISADWADDDSILGDFLRAIQASLESDEQPFELRSDIPQRPLPREVAEALSVADTKATAAALREAAVLGFDLLRGDETPTRNTSAYASHAEMEG